MNAGDGGRQHQRCRAQAEVTCFVIQPRQRHIGETTSALCAAARRVITATDVAMRAMKPALLQTLRCLLRVGRVMEIRFGVEPWQKRRTVLIKRQCLADMPEFFAPDRWRAGNLLVERRHADAGNGIPNADVVNPDFAAIRRHKKRLDVRDLGVYRRNLRVRLAL